MAGAESPAECIKGLGLCLNTNNSYKNESTVLKKEIEDLKNASKDTSDKLYKAEHPVIPEWIKYELSFILGAGLMAYGIHKLQ